MRRGLSLIPDQIRSPLHDHSDDLIITIHALERIEERWPRITIGLTDLEVARLIQDEVNDALVAGRCHHSCPLELANTNLARWRVEKNIQFVWTKNKERGYVIAEREEGIVVLTTLIGQDPEQAKRKLQSRRY